MILPITLTMAGAAALIAVWLSARVIVRRVAGKESIGDGGDPALLARMRAHANYTETTPFVLILIGGIELATGTHIWLWAVGGVFLLARIAHALGMDRPAPNPFRMIGMMVTLTVMIGLGGYAAAIPYLAPAALDSGAQIIDVG